MSDDSKDCKARHVNPAATGLDPDWRASSGDQWVVPLGGGVGRVMKLGLQPVNLLAQVYGNAVHPDGASPWGMRLQIQFLFPKFTKEQEKGMMEH